MAIAVAVPSRDRRLILPSLLSTRSISPKMTVSAAWSAPICVPWVALTALVANNCCPVTASVEAALSVPLASWVTTRPPTATWLAAVVVVPAPRATEPRCVAPVVAARPIATLSTPLATDDWPTAIALTPTALAAGPTLFASK